MGTCTCTCGERGGYSGYALLHVFVFEIELCVHVKELVHRGGFVTGVNLI